MVAYKGKPRATKDELAHMARVKELPCCLCMPGEQRSITEVHHILRGNRRLGNYFVLPYCRIKHHGQAYLYTHAERANWQKLIDDMGVVHDWPQSKVVRGVTCGSSS